jgi:glycosyltransferase involved in cell wall biosynthesis
MKISIIIPTYNCIKNLEKCLTSIVNQNYPDFEIICVDQSSTDNILEVTKKFNVQLITIEKPKFYSPPSNSRNIGAKVSSGEIIYHLDSDMTLEEGLLQEINDYFTTNQDVGALIVHETDITNGYWSKCKALERKCYWNDDKIESARVVRREVFENVKGYDESISSGEDFDIHRKYKTVTKIGFLNKVVFHDLRNLNYQKLVIKKYNYGLTSKNYLKKYNLLKGESVILNQFKCFIKNYKLLIKNPLVTFGMVFLKISEIVSGSLGLFKSYLK